MLDIDDRRLTPTFSGSMQPPAHLLENAVDGRVTRRRADRLHGGLPVITDVELQAPSRMQINTVAKHPVGETTQGIQRIRGSSLRKRDLLELELIVLSCLLEQLSDLVVNVGPILRSTGVRERVHHIATLFVVRFLPPLLQPLDLAGHDLLGGHVGRRIAQDRRAIEGRLCRTPQVGTLDTEVVCQVLPRNFLFEANLIDEVNESLEFVGSQGTFLTSLTNAQVRQHTHHAEQLECGMRLLSAHVSALSRQFVVADETAFLGASLRGLCLEHNANQTITFRGFDPLDIADPTNLLRIIALVKFASQDPLGASELRSAGAAHVVGMRQVGVHQLPGSRISRESPPQLLTNTIVEPLEEVTGFGGLQQRLHLRVGIPPASVTGDMTQRNRQRFLALLLVRDVAFQQACTHVPRLSRILKRSEIG